MDEDPKEQAKRKGKSEAKRQRVLVKLRVQDVRVVGHIDLPDEVKN
jgi:hypothetical protein